MARGDRPAAAHSAGRSRHIARIVWAIVLTIVLFAAGMAVGLYRSTLGAITTVPDLAAPAQSGQSAAPPADLSAGQPVTFLIIGTDDRSGDNADIGGYTPGARGDTTVLVHISADRSSVRMASIPRDLMTEIPTCASAGQDPSAPTFDTFNTAFTTGYGENQDTAGAIQCVASAVASTTGITPDAAVLLDFHAVVGVVDALGGVQLCGQNHYEPEDVGGLVLEPGCHTLDGLSASKFLRARYGMGEDGSDLKRITRQQCFLRTLSSQFIQGGVFTQVPRALNVASIVAQNTTLTANLAQTSTLVGLMYSLRGLTPAAVESWSPPLADYPDNPAKVIWGEGAEQFWADFAADPAPAASAPTTGGQSGQSDQSAQSGTGASDATEGSSDGTPVPAQTGPEDCY